MDRITSSRDVAEFFGKRHADVLRSIDGLIEESLTQRSFALSSFLDESGKECRCFDMDRDGFTLLAMGC
jgi:Rha family phage regulatory protein